MRLLYLEINPRREERRRQGSTRIKEVSGVKIEMTGVGIGIEDIVRGQDQGRVRKMTDVEESTWTGREDTIKISMVAAIIRIDMERDKPHRGGDNDREACLGIEIQDIEGPDQGQDHHIGDLIREIERGMITSTSDHIEEADHHDEKIFTFNTKQHSKVIILDFNFSSFDR